MTSQPQQTRPATGRPGSAVTGALVRLAPSEIVRRPMLGAAAAAVLLPVSAIRLGLVLSSPHRVVDAELALLAVIVLGVLMVASFQWNTLTHRSTHPRIGEYFCPRQRLTLRLPGRTDLAWVVAGTLDPAPHLGDTLRLRPAWFARRTVRAADRLARPGGPVAARIRIELPAAARLARYLDQLGVGAAVLAVVLMLVLH